MARLYSANVLQTTAGGRRLWHLSARGDGFELASELTLITNEPTPPDITAKDWHTLFRQKLNIAWLPADKVFIRSVQLPSSDPAEVASMVELQLEKLSPLPVTHIVWSYFLLPRPVDQPESLQTVIVIIAQRSQVEEFLGQLQNEGFLTDRLEAPGLEQLLATDLNADGIWIFTGEAGDPALVTWRYGGTIQNISLTGPPAGPERGAVLRTQLEQVAWAGELEGWLTGPLKVIAVTPPGDVPYWKTTFEGWGDSFETVAPPSQAQLVAASAKRCSVDGTTTSLLPVEYVTRYHQQFVDRLWLRGLMGFVTAYILGVLFYFGMLYMFQLKTDSVKRELSSMGPSYTNSMRDVEQIRILRERQNLKYAALDCWKAVAENLPDSMTVDTMYFQQGRFELRGSVVPENQEDVGNFNESLRTVHGPDQQALFTEISPPTIRLMGNRGDWSFNCTLKSAATP